MSESTLFLNEYLLRKHNNVYSLLKPDKEEPCSKFPRKNIDAWKHFVKINRKEMIAQCNYCQRHFSYKALSNLKQHLLRLHEEKITDSDDPILLNNTEDRDVDNYGILDTPKTKKIPRIFYNPLWNYFKRNQATLISECFLCGNSLSYKTTIANLKAHLKSKHKDAYVELCRLSDKPRSKPEKKQLADTSSYSEVLYHSDKSDDDAEESLKLTNIWNYFEEEAGKARCVVCRASMTTDYEDLKAHLQEDHPKLLLQLLQDKEESDAGSNNGDDDNTYTEIVYLEQEPEDVKPKEFKPKQKSKYVSKPSPIISRKRERRCSTPDDIPLKQKKSELSDDSDELTVFIKYITCLLKKLPPGAFSQVQIEIINSIQKASSNASTSSAVESSPHIIFNKELPATSITDIRTVNEVHPEDSAQMTPNYTITVAEKDENQQENS